MTLEVTKICRTCLGLEGELLSIYQTKGFSNLGNVSDMLTEITDTSPDKSDGFPENVCLECIREINRCYSFKLKCENSYSTLELILLGNLKDSQELKKSELHKSDSELKILNKKITSAPSNNLNLVTVPSAQTVCSNNQNKGSAAEKVTEEPERDELMNSDSFEMMISKMIFEDNEVDCLDILVPSQHKGGESTKVNEETDVTKNSVIQISHDSSESSDCTAPKKNTQEIKPNIEKKALLESALLNGNEDNKGEFEIHLSCEAINFKSDIIVRNSPKKRESSFPCSKCGKVFKLWSSLLHHIPIHNETRPYCCKYCGRKFRYESTHKLHELTHVKNKPYQCEKCYISFVSSKELQAHLLAHKNICHYVCAICFKKFRYANALRSHVKTHMGEQPYVCTHCPKRYMHLSSLITHHNRHTEKELSIKEINECKYCQRFLNKKNQKQNQQQKF